MSIENNNNTETIAIIDCDVEKLKYFFDIA
jgi:hypothetical protein